MIIALVFAAVALLCSGAWAKADLAVVMQGVKTQSSGSNYIVSGTVVVTNVGTSNTAVSTVQTMYFISGTTWAPIYTPATCLVGSSGPITVKPGQKLNCQFSQQMAKTINGKATVPGTISGKATATDGTAEQSAPTTVSAPTPVPPPSPKMSVRNTNVQTTSNGANYMITGNSVVVNTGTVPIKISEVDAMYFVSGTTWAPYQTTATCLVGATYPITVQPGKSLNCRFGLQVPKSVNGKKTTPGSLYSKAFTSTGQSESSPTTAVSGATPVGGR